MSKMAHTPGPWGASFTDYLGGPASYCRIRPVSGEMFGQFTSLEIATMNMMDEAEQQANARLIAAAPELLEALIHLEKLHKDWDKGSAYVSVAFYEENMAAIEKARAAITKAAGAADG